MPARQANPIARKHALKALEIDETNAEAHSALGWIHQFYDWNGDTAEKEFKRAIEANPAYTPAHYWYSASLFLAGRWDEGMRENKNALEVDPLSVHAHTQFGWNLCGMRRCEESIALLKRALELNPDYALANWLLGANYFLLSRRDEAIAEYQQAVKSSNRSPWMLSWLGFAYSACGQTQKAREVLAELTARSKSECVQSLFFAVVYAGLGEDDEAFAWLERSFENRDGYLIAISTDPTFESLRNDPRFRTLVEKINRAAE